MIWHFVIKLCTMAFIRTKLCNVTNKKVCESVSVGFDFWSFGESYLEAKGILPMRKVCMIEASWNKHGRKTVFFLALLSLQKPVSWLSDMFRQVQFSASDAWVISISFITPRSLVNYGANWVLTKRVEQLWAINVIWLIFFIFQQSTDRITLSELCFWNILESKAFY